MSVQNNLKKPVFTKSMLGYTPKEVDQYIEYMNERYAAVSRDVSELKRRVTRLQLGLETSAAETEVVPQAETGFSDAALEKLRRMIAAERSRHEEALDALLSFIETHSHGESIPEAVSVHDFADEDDGFVPLDDEESAFEHLVLSEEDVEWEEALEGFISDAGDDATDTVEANTDEDEGPADEEEVLTAPISEEYITESEEDTESEEAQEAQEAVTEKKKTPAELAAELDFYSDTVVKDGESYDPMTLAQNATMKRRRPTLEDFMSPLGNDEKPKQRR